MNTKTLAALMTAASILTMGTVHAAEKATAKPTEPPKATDVTKSAEGAKKKTERTEPGEAAKK
jgi:hypothetical protein